MHGISLFFIDKINQPKLFLLLKSILVLSLLFSSTHLKSADIPVIAAAASMKFALEEINHAFHTDTGEKLRISYSSSGNLTRQIQLGAPFELFLSANKKYIEQLYQQKKTSDKGIPFAIGRLVLLTSKDSLLTLDENFNGFKEALLNGQINRLAIANPEHAPYGVAAREVLQKLKIWNNSKAYLVLGENVAQAAQFASSGAAQAGLISYSLALAPALENKTRSILVPSNLHQPLQQTVVLLNNAGHTVRQFYHYLQQDKAKRILSHYGYTHY